MRVRAVSLLCWQAPAGFPQQQRSTISLGHLSDSYSTTGSGNVILTGGRNTIVSITSNSLYHCSVYYRLTFCRCTFCCTRLWDSDRDLDCVLRVRSALIFPDFVDQHYFFTSLQYPRRGTIGRSTIENWWGNTVYMKTADQQALPLRKVVPGEIFGSVGGFLKPTWS